MPEESASDQNAPEARTGPKPGRVVAGAISMASVEHMTKEQFERYALEVLPRELARTGWLASSGLTVPARAITHWIE